MAVVTFPTGHSLFTCGWTGPANLGSSEDLSRSEEFYQAQLVPNGDIASSREG
jgi:hypothetical protein